MSENVEHVSATENQAPENLADTDSCEGPIVDWDAASSTARLLTPAGPRVSREEGLELVERIRAAAIAARPHIVRVTGLAVPAQAPEPSVIDRLTWGRVNLESARELLEPALHQHMSEQWVNAPAPLRAVAGRIGATEMGAVLAYLSCKVLGQYDLAPGRPADAASLVLVAPNIVDAERDLELDPDDFRLWVCLHEETHRVQFTATPWLREHIIGLAHMVGRDLAPSTEEFFARLKTIAGNIPRMFDEGGAGVAGLLWDETQRQLVGRVTAVMSLLEGHADVMMDEVGPDVVPTVATIRERFETRRVGRNPLDVLVRRLMGLEAKAAQYRDGAAFVRSVIDTAGRDGFNRVWERPENLPTPEEIAEPSAWVRRVVDA